MNVLPLALDRRHDAVTLQTIYALKIAFFSIISPLSLHKNKPDLCMHSMNVDYIIMALNVNYSA